MAAADGASARKSIYRTALILTALTALEFTIAGLKHHLSSTLGLSEGAAGLMVLVTFVVLTIFKAFYIVAEFMHLKHEVKVLAFTIVLPFLFILWLIIGLVVDGDYWGEQTALQNGFEVEQVQPTTMEAPATLTQYYG
ncbi:MAG: hypothetical protein D6722_01665 [Bacteroidetes bacterium]|nr:MAG: hypothetical protein D6722_01665 [Bacteroidota bacterium]